MSLVKCNVVKENFSDNQDLVEVVRQVELLKDAVVRSERNNDAQAANLLLEYSELFNSLSDLLREVLQADNHHVCLAKAENDVAWIIELDYIDDSSEPMLPLEWPTMRELHDDGLNDLIGIPFELYYFHDYPEYNDVEDVNA